jgi:hypothetical protein
MIEGRAAVRDAAAHEKEFKEWSNRLGQAFVDGLRRGAGNDIEEYLSRGMRYFWLDSIAAVLSSDGESAVILGVGTSSRNSTDRTADGR